MYCDLTELRIRFGLDEINQLIDPDGTGPDESIAQAELATASASIDSYLAGRYTLPLTVAPVILTGICADLTRYALYRNAVPELVKERYLAAVRWLRDVADGKASLGLSTSQATPATDAAIEIKSGGNVWHRDASKGFI
jgi:phage gp36-like protein